MEAWLAALEASGPAQYFRFSRLPYAALNGAHIFSIALLVGSATPLAMRLLGFWRDIPAATFRRVLSPVAATGLGFAVLTGFALFSIHAGEYAGLGVFQVKMLLVLLGLCGAAIAHARHVFRPGTPRAAMAVHGAISILAWTSALACGRWIAFAGD